MDAPLENHLFGCHRAENFQEACVEEWEQEVHTTSPAWSISADELQEHECHREDSNTLFPRAHELSDHETFVAFSSGADPWDESDSPCEPYSAQKPTNDDWAIPMVCRQYHQGYHLRPSLLGSPIQIHTQMRTLGSSAPMCLDRRTSQQR